MYFSIKKNVWFSLVVFIVFLSELYSDTIRIMPLGDSITYDNRIRDLSNPRPLGDRSAYRNYLWYKLKAGEYRADFVGSSTAGQDIIPSFDPHNEGHPGYSSYKIAEGVYDWVRVKAPHIILLHIGSNDNQDSINGIRDILDEIDIYESNYGRNVKVILAQIIDRTYHPEWVTSLNNNIRNLVNSRQSNGDNIVMVNMQTGAGINYSTDMEDSIHPNDVGYSKMANVWYAALRGVLPAPTPISPTSLHNTYTTITSVVLSWSDNSNIETGYKVYRGNTHIDTLGANVTSYTLNSLSTSSTYTYSVVAYNSAGNSSSTTVTFSLPEPVEPTNAQATNIESNTALLTWSDNSNIETGFKIYQNGTLIATVNANVTSYALSDLRGNTTYTYDIVSYNSAGDSEVVTITFTTNDDYGWLPAVYHVILY